MNERICFYGSDPGRAGSDRTEIIVALDRFAFPYQADAAAYLKSLDRAAAQIKKVDRTITKPKPPMTFRGGSETRRNGPCPCGSGRKFKNCGRRGTCP